MTVQPTIGDWDTSHVTNFAHMFRNTKDLVTIDALARWNVTAAQTFEGMFEGDQLRRNSRHLRVEHAAERSSH